MGLAKREIETFEQENDSVRSRKIIQYLPFVKSVVHRIAVHLPAAVEIDDLINAGVIGLMSAVENYDPTRDNKFATYAMFRIRGEVLSELRSRDFLSRSSRSKIRALENTYAKLEQELGREIRDEEVAREMDIGLDEFYQIRTMSNMSFISFEEMRCFAKEEKESLMNYLVNSDTEDPSSLTRLKEIKGCIASAIEDLPEKEKKVVSLYYWDELTMKEIGEVLEITESRVSQLHSQAIIHLKAKLRRKGLAEV